MDLRRGRERGRGVKGESCRKKGDAQGCELQGRGRRGWRAGKVGMGDEDRRADGG